MAVGVATAGHWAIDLPNAANEKFVGGFRAVYKRDPSFYAAQAYDAANFINSAVVAVTRFDRQRGHPRGFGKARLCLGPWTLQLR